MVQKRSLMIMLHGIDLVYREVRQLMQLEVDKFRVVLAVNCSCTILP
jgi:choline kinase